MSESSIHADNDRVYSPEAEQTAAGGEAAVQSEMAAPLDINQAARGLGNTQLPKIHRQALAQAVGQQFGNKQLQRMVGGAAKPLTRVSKSAGLEGGPMESDLVEKLGGKLSSGGGSPVPEHLRQDAEAKSGQDLSDVTIHKDDELARATGSIAFATKRQIVTSSSATDDTLKHELGHVVGQSKSDPIPTQIGHANSHEEHEADAFAAGTGPGNGTSESGSVMAKRDPSLTRSADTHADGEEEDLHRSADPHADGEEEDLHRSADPHAGHDHSGEEEELPRSADPHAEAEEEELPRSADPHAGHDHSEDEDADLHRTAAPEEEHEEEEA